MVVWVIKLPNAIQGLIQCLKGSILWLKCTNFCKTQIYMYYNFNSFNLLFGSAITCYGLRFVRRSTNVMRQCPRKLCVYKCRIFGVVYDVGLETTDHFILYVITFAITNKKLTTWRLENFTGKKIMSFTISRYMYKLLWWEMSSVRVTVKRKFLLTQKDPRQKSLWISHNHYIAYGGDHLTMVPCVWENRLVKCRAYLIEIFLDRNNFSIQLKSGAGSCLTFVHLARR